MSCRLLRTYGTARRCTGDRRAVARNHIRRDTERQQLTERRTTGASAIGSATGYRRKMTATRRLAAILAADVAGYSRLIGADEEGTLNRLKAIRAELIDPNLTEHRGRTVKTTGDGLLVEFGSVVDALRCATEWQRGVLQRNAAAPGDHWI